MANGLGRGLGSLIPQKIPSSSKKSSSNSSNESIKNEDNVIIDDKNRIIDVDVSKIKPNTLQPRKRFDDSHIDELAESIKTYGIIQPLVVQKADKGYELIAGERRLRASKKAGLKTVPVIVRKYDDQKKLEVALIENIQRQNLDPIEEALAYKQLMNEFDLKVEEVAKRVGKSRPAVSNTIRLLSLQEEIQDALIKGSISEGHARYLLGIESEIKRMEVFRKIVHNNWSVNETGKQVRRMGGTKESRIKSDSADADKEAILRRFFGTRAEIKRKEAGGQIILDFYSDDELVDIIKKIK